MNRSITETRRISVHRIDGRYYFQFNILKHWFKRMGLDKTLAIEIEWNDELIHRPREGITGD